MADLTKIDLTEGTILSAAVTADGAAASQTIVVDGKSHKQFMRIYNGSGQTLTVTIVAPTDAAKKGVRAALGNYVASVANGATKYLNLADTARYMDTSTGKITVTAASSGTLGSATFELVQF